MCLCCDYLAAGGKNVGRDNDNNVFICNNSLLSLILDMYVIFQQTNVVRTRCSVHVRKCD